MQNHTAKSDGANSCELVECGKPSSDIFYPWLHKIHSILPDVIVMEETTAHHEVLNCPHVGHNKT